MLKIYLKSEKARIDFLVFPKTLQPLTDVKSNNEAINLTSFKLRTFCFQCYLQGKSHAILKTFMAFMHVLR